MQLATARMQEKALRALTFDLLRSLPKSLLSVEPFE
jgi:hypothetical protein